MGEQDLGRGRPRRLGQLGRGRCRSASKSVDELAEACWSMLSPRYMTKSSSPRKSRAISTQWARPERRVLGDVGDVDTEPGPVADRGPDLVAGVADDDADVLDARRGHVLDAVEEDRLVGHRYELLGARVGDRAQAGAGAAGEDQALHSPTSVARHVVDDAGRSQFRHDGMRRPHAAFTRAADAPAAEFSSLPGPGALADARSESPRGSRPDRKSTLTSRSSAAAAASACRSGSPSPTAASGSRSTT